MIHERGFGDILDLVVYDVVLIVAGRPLSVSVIVGTVVYELTSCCHPSHDLCMPF